MQIDRNIWGPETQWITNTIDNNVAYSFRAALGAYMTHNWNDYLNSELELNALIDNGLSFCAAVEDKRDFYKAHSIVFDDNGDILPLYENTELINFLWAINPYWSYGHGMEGYLSYWVNDFPDRWSEWSSRSAMLSADGHFGFQATPIFKQKLNKILGFLYVRVSSTNTVEASTIEMTLGTWISSGHNTHPYLRRVFMMLATCSNPGVNDWTGFCHSTDYYFDITLNLDCSYEIKSKGSMKSSYGFYAASSKKQQVTIMGFSDDDWAYIDSGHHPIGVDPDETHYFYNENHDKVAYIREYSESLIEEIYHQVAFYGIFFTGEVNYNETCSLYDNKILCGTIDEDGFTHGEYTRGIRNLLQPQFDWEDTEDSPFDPNYEPISEDYRAHGTHLSATAHAHGGNYYFSDTASAFTTLLNEINNITVPSGGWQEDNTFYGQEPLSCIIESRLIFMQNPYTDNSSAVQLGAFTSQDVSLPFKLSTEIQEYVYPPIKVQTYYNDFRDYAPYTSVFLWFPFCGSLELDTNIVMGHYINLTEEIDPLTGDIKVIVRVDDSEYYTMTGNCACDLSVSGFNMSQYAQTRLSLQMQQVGAQFNAGASLIGGLSGGSIAASLKNPTGATLQMLGGGINYGGSLYQARQYKNLNFKMKPSVGRADKAAGNIEEGAVYLPMIIVTRPRILPEYETSLAGYIAQNGIATHTIGKIGDQTGFVQCENPHVDVTATPEEQAQIAQLLESGIRIK